MERIAVEQAPTVDAAPASLKSQRTKRWLGITLVVAAVGIGSWFRLADLGSHSLTHAEAWRARHMYDGGIDRLRRLPPYQLSLGWVIQHTVGREEWMLRLPHALAGIAAIGAVAVLAYRWAGTNSGWWAAAAAAGAVAVHPALIELSRQLKTFGDEALWIALLFIAGDRVLRARTRRSFAWFTLIGVVGLGMAYTPALALAAWFPVLVLSGLRNRSKAYTSGLTVSGLVLLGVGCCWFYWLSRCEILQSAIDYHGDNFGAWPASMAPSALAAWAFHASYGTLRYDFGMTHCWPPLDMLIGALSLLLLALAVQRLVRSPGNRLACFFLLVIIAVAGILKKWPMCELHTVAFTIPLSAAGIGVGLSLFVRRFGLGAASWLLVLVCLGIPTARAVKATIRRPPPIEHSRPVFAHMTDNLRPGDAIYVYYGAHDAFEHYWRGDGIPVLHEPSSDRGDMDQAWERLDQWLDAYPTSWVVFSHLWGNEHEEFMGRISEQCEILDSVDSMGASACRVRKNSHTLARKREEKLIPVHLPSCTRRP